MRRFRNFRDFRRGDDVLFGPDKLPAKVLTVSWEQSEMWIDIPSPYEGGWGTSKLLKDTQMLEHASPLVALSRTNDEA